METKQTYQQPSVSNYFAGKVPNDIRMGSIKFSEREDDVELINGAIGNVALPMHPKLQERMRNLGKEGGGFPDGVVRYEPTSGRQETKDAFRNIIEQMGFDSSDLKVQVTDGGTLAMEILLLGVAGKLGEEDSDRPIMLIDPTYTTYDALAKRLNRKTVSIRRTLNDEGHFTFPDVEEIEKVIEKENPNALLMIPYDNPTGQMYSKEMMMELAELCVKHNMWFVSDEAYRGLFYDDEGELLSIWGVTDQDVPGIEGRRISVETASKIWNACGLRIGALVTDSPLFAEKMEAEYTSNLSANSIGQYVFGALAHESREDIFDWLEEGQNYYKDMNSYLYEEIKKLNPDFIVSQPEASIYTVIDLENATKPGFTASEFVAYCAEKGSVMIEDVPTTLLVAPMGGFYKSEAGEENPGMTQIRISYCEPAEKMKHVPYLLTELLREYEATR